MKFFFSGIAGRREYEMLAAAGVSHILVDPADAKHIPPARRIGFLDSGAYRAYKSGGAIDLPVYLDQVKALGARADLIAAPDVIGNADLTFENWQRVKDKISAAQLVPVWEWQGPQNYLERYLKASPIVGIGGLAKLMRAGDKTVIELRRREKATAELLELCRRYPQRFHIFGLNYLKAVEMLAPLAFSADSSSWLRGGRYGYVIFRHTRNGHLTQAPAKFIPEYKDLDRAGRCVSSARNIQEYLESVHSLPVLPAV